MAVRWIPPTRRKRYCQLCRYGGLIDRETTLHHLRKLNEQRMATGITILDELPDSTAEITNESHKYVPH
jgi:hypothetical protein